jgi:hypothetical protein
MREVTLSILSLIGDPSWQVELVPANTAGEGRILQVTRESDARAIVQRLGMQMRGTGTLRRLLTRHEHRQAFLVSEVEVERQIALSLCRGELVIRARLNRLERPQKIVAPSTGKTDWTRFALTMRRPDGEIVLRPQVLLRVVSEAEQQQERDASPLPIANAAEADNIACQLAAHPATAAQLQRAAKAEGDGAFAQADHRERLAQWAAARLTTGKIRVLVWRRSVSYAPAPEPRVAKPAARPVPPPFKPNHWIEIVLVDQDGKPVPNEPYEIILSNGFVVSGALDADGRAREEGIVPGTCRVTFPRIHAAEWRPA